MHFVDHARETMSSIALRYRVPVPALRRANNLYADHLLAARRTVLIPAEYYRAGVSLSPRPVEGEEEELRKAKIRRWMVACKVAEYVVYPFLFPPSSSRNQESRRGLWVLLAEKWALLFSLRGYTVFEWTYRTFSFAPGEGECFAVVGWGGARGRAAGATK